MGCAASNRGAGFDPNIVSPAHFEIERVVGEGGFGKVNAAVRKTTQEWFAVKKLSKIPILASGNIAQIFNERNLLASVTNHPFMVNLHYAFQDAVYCYLVMDLQLGGDLRYHLKSRSCTPDQARFYTACIASALHHLHESRILHRDVKPDNVVLDSCGYPRLTDLGLSYKCPPGPTLGFCEQGGGTIRYMAPEQRTIKRLHDHNADFWQLGMCAHEFLTSTLPHRACPPSWVAALETEDFLPGDDFPDLRADVDPTIPYDAREFVSGLLQVASWRRISCVDGNDHTSFLWIEKHPWFKNFDWDACRAKTMPAPFVPDTSKSNCNTGNNDLLDFIDSSGDDEPTPPLQSDQDKFAGYDYLTNLIPGDNSAAVVVAA
jgi:serine/threonine kinase 32